MGTIANRNVTKSGSDPKKEESGSDPDFRITPISEFLYASFTRRGVAFRGVIVKPENIPGHPGSAATALQARPRLPNRSRDVPRASASILPPWAAVAASRV